MPDAPDLARLAAQWAADPTTTIFAPLAEALRKRGDLSQAADIAAQGTAVCPDFLPGWLVLAAIRDDQGEAAAALVAIEHAARLDPGHPLVQSMAARARANVGRPESNAPVDNFVPEGAGAPPQLPERHAAASIEAEISDDVELDVAPEYPDAGADTGELMFGEEVDELGLDAETGELASMSLASLYQGQGHLNLAVQVLDALLARDPADHAARERRDAIRAELDSLRPPSYRADPQAGRSVRNWLAAMANATPPAATPSSSFDAFYQPPADAPAPRTDDFAAFQSWLKELDR